MKIAPPFIKQEIFDKLKSREKAYLIFLFQKRYTKSQIMKKLYIDNERTYRRLQNKMRNIINGQIDRNKKT